ncbi:MAG: hypothetical protein ACI9TO_000843, partial [Rickettsiales bacterium]
LDFSALAQRKRDGKWYNIMSWKSKFLIKDGLKT